MFVDGMKICLFAGSMVVGCGVLFDVSPQILDVCASHRRAMVVLVSLDGEQRWSCLGDLMFARSIALWRQ